MKSLSQEQIFSRLCVHYHDDYRALSETIIRPDENVLWAGNYSYRHPHTTGLIGYGILTSVRFIWVWFNANDIPLFGRHTKIIGNQTGYVEIPNYPLTSGEKKSRLVNEIFFKNIGNLRRQDYVQKHEPKKLIEVSMLGHDFVFDEYENGVELYNLLFERINTQENEVPSSANLAEQIRSLKELYQYQVLTEQEYKAAMKRLGIEIE